MYLLALLQGINSLSVIGYDSACADAEISPYMTEGCGKRKKKPAAQTEYMCDDRDNGVTFTLCGASIGGQ